MEIIIFMLVMYAIGMTGAWYWTLERSVHWRSQFNAATEDNLKLIEFINEKYAQSMEAKDAV